MRRHSPIFSLAAAAALLAGDEVALADRTCFALESQVFQLQVGGIDRREAARIRMLRQRLARAGCGRGGQDVRTAEPRRQRGFSGSTNPRSHGLRRPPDPAPQSKPEPSSRGTYRTMCVRTCDGYYFPVSFSTTRQHFAEDAETCARMCPGAGVALYTHSVPDEVPAQMVSLAGEPYSELATAFSYRKRFDPSCGCGVPDAPAAAVNAAQEAGKEDSLAALPRPRPDPAQDPETVANRLGGFVITDLEPVHFASERGRFGKPIRVVGPATLSSQTSELLLRPVSP